METEEVIWWFCVVFLEFFLRFFLQVILVKLLRFFSRERVVNGVDMANRGYR